MKFERRKHIQRQKYVQAMLEKRRARGDLDEDEARYYPRFFCLDCGADTHESGEYYMVSDDVWAASGLAPNDGMLCLTCLERRIKRPLTRKDFTCVWPTIAAWERYATRQRR